MLEGWSGILLCWVLFLLIGGWDRFIKRLHVKERLAEMARDTGGGPGLEDPPIFASEDPYRVDAAPTLHEQLSEVRSYVKCLELRIEELEGKFAGPVAPDSTFSPTKEDIWPELKLRDASAFGPALRKGEITAAEEDRRVAKLRVGKFTCEVEIKSDSSDLR